MTPIAYDDDIVTWSEEQARALRTAARSGTNLPIDWEHVAEEIEASGKSQASELASRMAVILIHLMKLEASPAIEPRAGWKDTMREQRDEIDRLLGDAPSVKAGIPAVIGRELSKARNRVRIALAGYGERPGVDLDAMTFTEEQVLGSWFPGGGG